MFYRNSDVAANGYFRGAILRADGEGTTTTSRVGAIVLHATTAGVLNTQSGRIEILAVQGTSGVGKVNMWSDVTINRDLDVGRTLVAVGEIGAARFVPQTVLASTAVAASSSITVTHGLGVYPGMIMAYLFNVVATSNPNGITPLPTPDSNMYIWDNTTTTFKIWNGFTGTRNVIARVFK